MAQSRLPMEAMRPASAGEAAPSVLAGIENGLVARKHAIGEEVLAQILPDVFLCVELRALGRQKPHREDGGFLELFGWVPAGLVEQDDSRRTRYDVARNRVQMLPHGPTIGVRKGQRGTDVASRADGTEDIGILVALISGLAWAAATLGPLIDEAVLLSNARLVLEPDLNRRSRPDALLPQRRLSCLCEFFVKVVI